MIGLKGMVGGGFAVMGGVMLLVSLYNLGQIAACSLFGETVQGEVFTTESRSSARGSSSVPVVRFRDTAGQEHLVTGRIGLRRHSTTHEIEERVRVAYPEGRPEDAVLADGKTIAWTAFLSLFLSGFVALGIWLIRSDRREMREDGWID